VDLTNLTVAPFKPYKRGNMNVKLRILTLKMENIQGYYKRNKHVGPFPTSHVLWGMAPQTLSPFYRIENIIDVVRVLNMPFSIFI
jgi:hypothetical protein